MSLCPAPSRPADTQAGSLGSAAQSVLVSWGLEASGEGQRERLVGGGGLLPLALQEARSTGEILYKPKLLSPPARDRFLIHLLMADWAL